MDVPETKFPRRPPRLTLRLSQLAPFYFVTFNTARRAASLARPEVHDVFRAFCTRGYQERDIVVGRYVLMPDHAHLFVLLPPTGITLPRWVQSLRTVLGKELLRLGYQKPHWQEGFFDHLLRNGDSYAQKWKYVRMNPVRAGLCAELDEWPYAGAVVDLEFR